MIQLLPLNAQLSAELRDRLEAYITKMFTNSAIDGSNTIGHAVPNAESLPCVRSAYNIWSAMHVEDRYVVLRTFSLLYVGRPNTLPCDEPTIAFCMVFINELAAVLIEAAQWPH